MQGRVIPLTGEMSANADKRVPVFGENPRPPDCHSEAIAEESGCVYSLRCLRFFTSFRMTNFDFICKVLSPSAHRKINATPRRGRQCPTLVLHFVRVGNGLDRSVNLYQNPLSVTKFYSTAFTVNVYESGLAYPNGIKYSFAGAGPQLAEPVPRTKPSTETLVVSASGKSSICAALIN